jgi:ATP adenylyltransferase
LSLYCLENHRTAEQLEEMQQLESAGRCLFCPAGMPAYVRRTVLHETSWWTVVPNKFPYRSDLLDLEPSAQQDFWNVLAGVRERYGLRHYGLGVRNGDCRFTGATVAHVHAHVLVGDPASSEEIRMRFSSAPVPRRGT